MGGHEKLDFLLMKECGASGVGGGMRTKAVRAGGGVRAGIVGG